MHAALGGCGFCRKPQPGPGGEPEPEELSWARLRRSSEGVADVAGVLRCSSPWACPVCAPRVAAHRALTLQPQVEQKMRCGWSAYLVTLTIRHTAKTSLEDSFKLLNRGWARLTSGKRWDKLRKLGGLEYVRGYDVTWSARHGWHAHIHFSLYLSREHGDGREVAEWLLARWLEIIASLGGEALPGAQHFQKVNDPAKAARYAVSPAAVYESLALAMKRKRTGKCGRTPFEILSDAVADMDAGRREGSRWVSLWKEYVMAVKGRRQVTASRGMHLSEDEPENAEEEDEPRTVAELGHATVIELDRTRTMADLLEAVEAGEDPDAVEDAVRGVLERLKATDWHVVAGWCEPRTAEPEPSPAPGPEPPRELPRPRWTLPSRPAQTGREWRQHAAYEAWWTGCQPRGLSGL